LEAVFGFFIFGEVGKSRASFFRASSIAVFIQAPKTLAIAIDDREGHESIAVGFTFGFESDMRHARVRNVSSERRTPSFGFDLTCEELGDTRAAIWLSEALTT
jgi:hypothetical protein